MTFSTFRYAITPKGLRVSGSKTVLGGAQKRKGATSKTDLALALKRNGALANESKRLREQLDKIRGVALVQANKNRYTTAGIRFREIAEAAR